jgi:hypothetical protein
VAEKIAAQIVPDVLCRVQLGRVGRKRHEHDILWHNEVWRTVPTSTVEDQQGDGTDADACADFGQMFVHGLDADCWHDQGGAGAARRADGAEQVGPGEPPVAPDARTRAALGPDAGQRALLANAGFILKPDFDRPAGKLLRDCGARQPGEVFLARITPMASSIVNA